MDRVGRVARVIWSFLSWAGRRWAEREVSDRSRRGISDGLEADHRLEATYGLPYYSIDR